MSSPKVCAMAELDTRNLYNTLLINENKLFCSVFASLSNYIQPFCPEKIDFNYKEICFTSFQFP